MYLGEEVSPTNHHLSSRLPVGHFEAIDFVQFLVIKKLGSLYKVLLTIIHWTSVIYIL